MPRRASWQHLGLAATNRTNKTLCGEKTAKEQLQSCHCVLRVFPHISIICLKFAIRVVRRRSDKALFLTLSDTARYFRLQKFHGYFYALYLTNKMNWQATDLNTILVFFSHIQNCVHSVTQS